MSLSRLTCHWVLVLAPPSYVAKVEPFPGNTAVAAVYKALTLDRDAFHNLLGRLESLRNMWRFEALQRVPLFAKLDNKTKASVAAALGQVQMPKGTAVVTQVCWNKTACCQWSCMESPHR
eukprot:GHUV01053026.1.p1 GENE.GHUV01053026.1~~GHUV01053026.1.p1  ORF type:complete len:120 (-),score=28.76 GHUV01053026.1:127-486(-)